MSNFEAAQYVETSQDTGMMADVFFADPFISRTTFAEVTSSTPVMCARGEVLAEVTLPDPETYELQVIWRDSHGFVPPILAVDGPISCDGALPPSGPLRFNEKSMKMLMPLPFTPGDLSRARKIPVGERISGTPGLGNSVALNENPGYNMRLRAALLPAPQVQVGLAANQGAQG